MVESTQTCDPTGDWNTSLAPGGPVSLARKGSTLNTTLDDSGLPERVIDGELDGLRLRGVTRIAGMQAYERYDPSLTNETPIEIMFAEDCETFRGTVANEDGTTTTVTGERTFRGEHSPLPFLAPAGFVLALALAMRLRRAGARR